jgi:hypothetical protein
MGTLSVGRQQHFSRVQQPSQVVNNSFPVGVQQPAPLPLAGGGGRAAAVLTCPPDFSQCAKSAPSMPTP